MHVVTGLGIVTCEAPVSECGVTLLPGVFCTVLCPMCTKSAHVVSVDIRDEGNESGLDDIREVNTDLEGRISYDGEEMQSSTVDVTEFGVILDIGEGCCITEAAVDTRDLCKYIRNLEISIELHNILLKQLIPWQCCIRHSDNRMIRSSHPMGVNLPFTKSITQRVQSI